MYRRIVVEERQSHVVKEERRRQDLRIKAEFQSFGMRSDGTESVSE